MGPPAYKRRRSIMTVTKRFFLLAGAFAFCAARALGRTVQRNKLVCLLGFAALALWAFTYDVGDGTVFELDGNAITTSTHDWDQVWNDSVKGTNTSGALAISFDTDVTNSNTDDIFQ